MDGWRDRKSKIINSLVHLSGQPLDNINCMQELGSYLPDVSFSCSIKSFPVISATEFGSMFESSSRSTSLNTDTEYRLLFSCPTNFCK